MPGFRRAERRDALLEHGVEYDELAHAGDATFFGLPGQQPLVVVPDDREATADADPCAPAPHAAFAPHGAAVPVEEPLPPARRSADGACPRQVRQESEGEPLTHAGNRRMSFFSRHTGLLRRVCRSPSSMVDRWTSMRGRTALMARPGCGPPPVELNAS